MARFLVMVKATKDSEARKPPSLELVQAMHEFNEKLQAAGVIETADGLQPSASGARVKFSKDGRKTLVDGPFPETKELVAGFWLWNCKSREEALQWAMKCPPPFDAQDCEIEVRPVFSAEDFEALVRESEKAAARK